MSDDESENSTIFDYLGSHKRMIPNWLNKNQLVFDRIAEAGRVPVDELNLIEEINCEKSLSQ